MMFRIDKRHQLRDFLTTNQESGHNMECQFFSVGDEMGTIMIQSVY